MTSRERLDQAQALFEAGQIVEAAEALHPLAEEAGATGDADLLEEIDDMVRQMRRHLRLAAFPELVDFDDAFLHGRASAAAVRTLPADRNALTPTAQESRPVSRRVWFLRSALLLGAVSSFAAGVAIASSSCGGQWSGVAFLVMLVPAPLVGAGVGVTDGEASVGRWVAATLVAVVLFLVLLLPAFAVSVCGG